MRGWRPCAPPGGGKTPPPPRPSPPPPPPPPRAFQAALGRNRFRRQSPATTRGCWCRRATLPRARRLANGLGGLLRVHSCKNLRWRPRHGAYAGLRKVEALHSDVLDRATAARLEAANQATA